MQTSITQTLPPAIVLGLNPNGLGIVKSLVPHGISVTAVDEAPDGWEDLHRWISSGTRLCQRVSLPTGSGSKATAEKLLEMGPGFAQKPIILPSSDADLLMVSENREKLVAFYEFKVPTPETLDLFVHKTGFHEYCRSLDVPAPATFTDVSLADLPGIDEEIRYPCVLKPEFRSVEWNRLFSPKKGLIAENRDELHEALLKVQDLGEKLLVQEVIPGPDSNLYFSHVYLDSAGVMLQGWTGHKVRQYPIHFGTSTLAETVDEPRVLDLTLRLLEPTGYSGYASVEFKRDPRDGSFRVMEVTAGRTWYPHALGLAAGVNIPLAWYRDIAGLPQEPRRDAMVPVRWVDEYRDLIASTNYMSEGELTLGEWLRSHRHLRGFAHLSLRDPVPGLLIVARMMLAVRNKLWAGIKRLVPGNRRPRSG